MINRMAESYPQLFQLFGAYFHQDWPVEGKDWQDLLRNYCNDHAPADFQAAASEIDQLLEGVATDSQLAEILWRQLGCYYLPRPDLGGPTVRDWLAQVGAGLKRLQ
jgi:hypothetical protein